MERKQKIEFVKQAKNISQRELADTLEISPSYLSKVHAM